MPATAEAAAVVVMTIQSAQKKVVAVARRRFKVILRTTLFLMKRDPNEREKSFANCGLDFLASFVRFLSFVQSHSRKSREQLRTIDWPSERVCVRREK